MSALQHRGRIDCRIVILYEGRLFNSPALGLSRLADGARARRGEMIDINLLRLADPANADGGGTNFTNRPAGRGARDGDGHRCGRLGAWCVAFDFLERPSITRVSGISGVMSSMAADSRFVVSLPLSARFLRLDPLAGLAAAFAGVRICQPLIARHPLRRFSNLLNCMIQFEVLAN